MARWMTPMRNRCRIYKDASSRELACSPECLNLSGLDRGHLKKNGRAPSPILPSFAAAAVFYILPPPLFPTSGHCHSLPHKIKLCACPCESLRPFSLVLHCDTLCAPNCIARRGRCLQLLLLSLLFMLHWLLAVQGQLQKQLQRLKHYQPLLPSQTQ